MFSGIHFTKIDSSPLSYSFAFRLFKGVTRTEVGTRRSSLPSAVRPRFKFGENDAIAQSQWKSL
jgi:hypothetical protein